VANIEGEADLAAWVRFALLMARPKGSVTFIHRADRMEQLLAQLAGRAGEIVVFPLWAGAEKPAKRIILRARKSVATPTRLTPGLVLHESDGRYTPAAEAVLRGGAALQL
jgi:tRNA1(Val) A37 N6-methylase TrmN6